MGNWKRRVRGSVRQVGKPFKSGGGGFDLGIGKDGDSAIIHSHGYEWHHPKRFFKNVEYIGITKRNKDAFGDWSDSMSLKKFRGRPYNPYEYDVIAEYTPEKWNELSLEVKQQAESQGRDVNYGENFIFQTSKWTHIPKKIQSGKSGVNSGISQGSGITTNELKEAEEELKTVKQESKYILTHVDHRGQRDPREVLSFGKIMGGLNKELIVLHIRAYGTDNEQKVRALREQYKQLNDSIYRVLG